MVAYKSAEETLTEYQSKYGEEEGVVMYQILQQSSNLYIEWRMLLYIYGSNPKRVEVLNEASPLMANVLLSLLWDSVLLRCRRLNDPSVSGRDGRNRNISLERLVEIDSDSHNYKPETMRELCVKSKENYQPLKPSIDKTSAHNDLDVHISNSIPKVTRRQTTRAVKSIKNAVDYFYYGEEEYASSIFPITSAKDEQAFLTKLYVGNLKQAEILIEDCKKDIENGPMAPLTNSIPEWLYDSRLRDKPFNIT